MMNWRKLLALALVAAMTLTMLPVVALADDEVAAVQTVEAPAAEPAAVEDVAEISAAPVEAAPIETAATETVAPKAELQALDNGRADFDDDEAALAEGYFLKLVVDGIGTAYYNSLSSAATDYKANCNSSDNRGVLTFLDDYTYYSTAAGSTGVVDLNYSNNTNSQYITFDLNGKTFTVRAAKPVFSRSANITSFVFVQNGTVIYQNIGRSDRSAIVYSNTGTATNSAGSTVMYLTARLENVKMISLAAAGGSASAVVSSNAWINTVYVTNSTLIAQETPAIEFTPVNKIVSGSETNIKKSVRTSAVNLTGECAIGSLVPECAAILYECPDAAVSNALPLKFSVKPDAARASKFLGGSFTEIKNDAEILTKDIPEDFTESVSVDLVMPDASTLAEESRIGVVPDDLGQETYDAYAHAHADPVHHEAHAATAAEPGNVEYWTCALCGKYFLDAELTQETTADAVFTEPLSCAHPNLEAHPAVTATYAAAGSIAYWYCPDCQKTFSDAAAANEIEASATLTPKLVDAGARSDAELVELGAVARCSVGEASTAYDNLQDAFAEARTWTVGGGAVRLLQDYTYYESSTSMYSGVLATFNDQATYGSWNLDNNSDPEITVKGFWFDLGGHTLAVQSGRPLFYILQSIPISIKNGTIVRQGQSVDSETITAERDAIVAWGYSSKSLGQALTDGSVVYTPEITFKNVNAYTLGCIAPYENKDGAVISLGSAASVINVIDSTLISKGTNFIYFRTSLKNTVAANVPEASHEINITATEGHSCTVGSLSASAIYSNTMSLGADNPLVIGSRSVNINTTGSERITFLGTAVKGGTYTDSTVSYDPKFSNVTTASVALPDGSSLTETAAGAAPGYLDAAEYPAIAYHAAHSLTHVEAVAATAAEPGMQEHWYCAECGTYFADAEGTVETTAEALVIPVLSCSHPNLQAREEIAATYSATGTAAHWYCPDCQKYFSDAEATNEVDAASLVIPKLIPDPNTCTEADLVAYGYVATATAPDGNVTAYTGLNAAFKAGAAWTEPGGVVKMIRDYTIVNTYSSSNEGRISMGAQDPSTNKSATYVNADDPTLNGFWVDLGGHTLTASTGSPLFYVNASIPVNIRNGRIIYLNTMQANTSHGIFKSGFTSSRVNSAEEIYRPVWTLKDLTVIRLKHASGGNNGGVFFLSTLQSEINVINSTLLTDDNFQPLYYYRVKPSANAAADAYALTQPYAHTVNVSGASVIGTSAAKSVAYFGAEESTSTKCASYSFTLNVSGEDAVFYGSAFADKSSNSLVDNINVPMGYAPAEEPVYVTLPDAATVAAEETADAVPEDSAEPTAFTPLIESTSSSHATFTPEGGLAGDEVSFSDALQAWVDAGYKGTVTINDIPDATELALIRSTFGGAITFNTSTSENNTATPLILIPAAASGGWLTLDLGENTMDAAGQFLGTPADLDGFRLTVQNGTVNMAAQGIILKGENVAFCADNAALLTTGATVIHDARGNGAYTILTGSEIRSVTRAAILLFSWSGNDGADPVLYYVKDSTIHSGFGGTVTGHLVIYNNAVSDCSARLRVFIYDGSNTLEASPSGVYRTSGTTRSYFLTTPSAPTGPVDGIYTVTTDGANSKLTTQEYAAATLTVGEALTLPFKNLQDATEFAEYFGSCALPVKLTLNKNATFSESKAAGLSPYATAFALDLNGKTLAGEGLLDPAGSNKTEITVTGAAGEAKIFANLPAFTCADGDKFVIAPDSLFTNYSLNLEDSVSINLYTDGENGDPDLVTYVQGDEEYTIAAPGEVHDWVVRTLAAKQMRDTIDAYAAKKVGTTTTIDFTKGVSVMGYVRQNPAEQYDAETQAALIEALNKTLAAMSVYGKYAEKYFKGDFGAITADELTAIGLEAIPDIDVSGLDDSAFAVSGMGNYPEDHSVESGYWGSAAVLEDRIGLKYYFHGAEFDAAATLKIGSAAAAAVTPVTIDDGEFKTVEAKVSAKDIEAPITVSFQGVGSVTDSIAAYTRRLIDAGSDAANLAGALRAYGAAAKVYAAAKG